MVKYVVCSTEEFYPWIREFDALEEAKEHYKNNQCWDHETIFLCEVLEFKRYYDDPHSPGEVIFTLSTKQRTEVS